jgi:hypothetical protein
MSQVILIIFVCKSDMVEAKVNRFKAKYMLEPGLLCHLANLILFLHLLILLRFLKHLLKEKVFENESINNFSVDSSLLLDFNRTFDSTFIRKVFEKRHMELVSKDSLKSSRS